MAELPDTGDRGQAVHNIDASLSVDAGAGTGKTTILIERILALVRAGTPLTRVAAITFTEKAAGELKMKLRARLEDELARSSGGETERFREALSDLERAEVSTIHAFAANLLRLRPVEASVDPGFTVLDELGATLLRQQAWEEWLAAETQGENPTLARALEFGLQLEQARALGDRLIDNRDLMHLLPDRVADTDASPFLAELGQAVAWAVGQTSACLNDTDRGRAAIDALAEHLRDIDSAPAEWRDVMLVRRSLRMPGNRRNWNPPDLLTAIKKRFTELDRRRQELAAAVVHNLLVDLAQRLSGCLERYEALKAAAGALDFADLLLRARNLLRDFPAMRHDLGWRYLHVLVDEFQDTDPLQAEIAFYLTEEFGPPASHWRAVRPGPGRLFFVGDPRQSIYRFRRADIQVYEEAKEVIGRRGAPLTLRANFRSVPSLIEWINAVFADLIVANEDRSQPAYIPVVATREALGETGVVALPVEPSPPAAGSTDQIRRAEARTIAAFLCYVVGKWPVRDRESGEQRSLGFGDIAILFRTSASVDFLEDALRVASIPYRFIGGKNYYRRGEVGMVLSLLRAVEDPTDTVSLVAALRSPLLGCSDEEIFMFTATGGRLNYMVSIDAGVHLREEFAALFTLLQDLHRQRNRMPTSRFLEETFARLRCLPFFDLKPQGDARVANLVKLAEMARSLQGEKFLSFRAFIHFLSDLEAQGAEGVEWPALDPDDNAVQLLTIHKAKGLEFPMVVLVDGSWDPRAVDRTLLRDRLAGRLELAAGPQKLGLETRGWKELAAREERFCQAEEIRILYVAATRPRDYLIIPLLREEQRSYAFRQLARGLPSVSPENLGKIVHPLGIQGPGVMLFDHRWLDLSLVEEKPFRLPFGADLAGHPSAPAEVWRLRAWENRLRDTREVAARPSLSGVSVTELVRRDGKQFFLEGGSRSGARFGNYIHEILAGVDLRTGEDVERLSRVLGARHAMSPAQRVQAVQLVCRALSHPLIRRATTSERLFREVPFVFHHEGCLVEGIVDLAFIEKGEWVVVDFKSDDVIAGRGMEERFCAYRPQAVLYAFAIQEITGMPVKEAVLFFLRPGSDMAIRAVWGEEARALFPL